MTLSEGRMAIEEILGSRSRLRILKLLYMLGELNLSEIARRIGVNYREAKKQVQILEAAGIITCKRFGRIKLYRLNEPSNRVKALEALIEAWEEA